ncbi:MAG TPA: hypothetical protein VGE45_16060 [Chloroflexia bacterium]
MARARVAGFLPTVPQSPPAHAKLREYRTAIISATGTGKIDVRRQI